jgi:hypothetical protein
VAALLFLPLSIVGCGDLAVTESGVEVTSPETVPALQFRADLPSLPDLVSVWDRSLSAPELLEDWRRSWEMSREEGRAVRAELNRAGALLLAPKVDRSRVEVPLAELDRALDAVAANLPGDRLPRELIPPVAHAAESRDRARQALEAGELADAIRYTLDGSDALRGITPDVLAGWLVATAEDHLRRNGDDVSYAEQTRERAERLTIGARTALEDEAPVLALRRAWYALQLLNGAGDH